MGAALGSEEKRRNRRMEDEEDDHGTKLISGLFLFLLALAVLGSLLGAIFSIWGWSDLDRGSNGCCINNTEKLENLKEIINHIKYNSSLALCTNIYNDMLPLLIIEDASCWRFGEDLFYSGNNSIGIVIVSNDVDISGNGFVYRVEENRTAIGTAGSRAYIHDMDINSISGSQNFYAGSGGISVVLSTQTLIKNVQISSMQTAILSFLSIDTEVQNFNVRGNASGGPADAIQEDRVVGGVRCIDTDRCLLKNGYILIGSDPGLVTVGLTSETFLLGRTRGFRADGVTAFAGDVGVVVTGSDSAYVGGASYFETQGLTNTAIACWVGDPFSEITASSGTVFQDVVCKNSVDFGDGLFIVNTRGGVFERVSAYQASSIATLTGALHVGFSQLGADVGENEAVIIRNSYFEAPAASPNVVVESQSGSIRFEHNVVQGGDNGMTILTNFSTFVKNTVQGHVWNGIYVGNDFFNAGYANLIEENHVVKSCESAIMFGVDTQGNQAVNNRLMWNTVDVTDLGTGNLVEDNKVTPALEVINCVNFSPNVSAHGIDSNAAGQAVSTIAVAAGNKLEMLRRSNLKMEQSLGGLMAASKTTAVSEMKKRIVRK